MHSKDRARRERREKRPPFESLARDRSLVETGKGIMAVRKTDLLVSVYLVTYSTFNVPGKIQAIPAPPPAAKSVAVSSLIHPTTTLPPDDPSSRMIECVSTSA